MEEGKDKEQENTENKEEVVEKSEGEVEGENSEEKSEEASSQEAQEGGEIDQDELAKSWEEALKEQQELSKAQETSEESATTEALATQDIKLDLQSILEIPLNVEVIIGETEMPLKDVLDLNPGAIVELNREISDTVDIRVNGKLVAKGEIVTVGEYFGVRIKEIFGKERKDVIGASVNKNI